MDDFSRGLDNLKRILDGRKRPGNLKLSVLSHITANFSEERKIGEGGCGRVYKGILPSGQIVAVKKLFNSHTDERMFVQEVRTMMMVKHKNIVRFLGYCAHAEGRALKMEGNYVLADKLERLLCFEYISKGSLEDYVTDELRGLEWDTRFQIIRGICEGLCHLHHMGKQGIIHMDLKPANILVDHDMVPKITDFGISRPGDISKTLSIGRMYSLKYCAPEYKLNGIMSFKSDIYSLGVIIIEMVTGTRNNDPDIASVCRRWRHRWNKSAKHTTLGWQQQVTKCLELAQRCKYEDPTKRPDIHDVMSELSEMDSTCMNIRDSFNSTVLEQRKSFLEDMLGIEPLELHLTAELNKKISHTVQLTNDTDDYIAFWIYSLEVACFRVSATCCLPISIHPTKDIAPPRSSCSVTITLEALKRPLQQKHCIEKFCVHSTRVDKDHTAKDITADIFKKDADKVVDMVNMMVSVHAPKKQLLVVKPHELRFPPFVLNRPLPCSVQLTNGTDDYIAFTFILPKGKVLYYQAMGTGIMPPRSTRGVVTHMLAKEEALPEMQRKETCHVRSVIVDKGLRDEDLRVAMFYEETGVQELELDIVFAAPPQQQQPRASSSAHRDPMLGEEQDWEENELMGLDALESIGDGPALTTSPFSIETELLHIYPAELRFASEGGAEYISLTNRTDHDVIYAINCDTQESSRVCRPDQQDRGVVPPQSTRAVLVTSKKKPYQFRVMMISGSRRYDTSDELLSRYTYDKLGQVMSEVRAEGGKAHEALLACIVVHAPQPKSLATKHQQHVVVLRMDANGLSKLSCMDIHPTEPWVVTGHYRGGVCIWKMDPKTNAYETIVSATNSKAYSSASVKFIARMQWVACGDSKGYITIYRNADNNRLTEMAKFKAEEGPVRTLAVHPSLPYLLSSSKCNFVKLWDWDQKWRCTRKFSCSSTTGNYMSEITFHPKDANSFASLDGVDGEINIWSIDSQGPTSSLRGGTVGIAYCNTSSDLQCMATVGWNGKIEILDSRSNATHVHALEVTGLWGRWSTRFIACHPTRPLLATSKSGAGVFLWNYTTHGLNKVPTLKTRPFEIMGLRFMDIKGFQSLVIPHTKYIEMVDIFCGQTFIGCPQG